MKKPKFKDRYLYWFDNLMARGSISMVKLLTITTLLIVLFITELIVLLGLQDEGGFLQVFWDILASTINAWMPYSDDGERIAYVILTAVSAIVGLLFTSVLIGIVGSAIEEKLTEMRRGSSRVVETGHIVVLGFVPGEYRLLRELVSAAADEKRCIVVVSELDKEEMESDLQEALDLPKNVRLICRTGDICSPQALSCCSIPTSRTVVISPTDDARTLRAALAVRSLLEAEHAEAPHIIATVSSDAYRFPREAAAERGIIMVQSHNLAARVIAHACLQPGLSLVFSELFDFSGAELYVSRIPAAEGRSFAALTAGLDGAVPLGFRRGGELLLNPPPETVCAEADELVYFADSSDSPCWTEAAADLPEAGDLPKPEAENGNVVLIGLNDELPLVLQELPSHVKRVVAAGIPEQERGRLQETVARFPNVALSIYEPSLSDPQGLENLLRSAAHVVLFRYADGGTEDGDSRNMMLLIRLRDIRRRLGLHFTITAELQRERNRALVANADLTDFIVASDLSSMVLAQLAEDPVLAEVFRELLSNEGNEITLMDAALFCPAGSEKSVSALRMQALSRGCVLLGWFKAAAGAFTLNPALPDAFRSEAGDRLVILSRNGG